MSSELTWGFSGGLCSVEDEDLAPDSDSSFSSFSSLLLGEGPADSEYSDMDSSSFLLSATACCSG